MMSTRFRKNATTISVFLLITVLILAWLYPASGILPSLTLVFSSFIVISMVIEKHQAAFLDGKISRRVFIRKVGLEVTGILLTIILAGLLGGYISNISVRQIDLDFTKLIVGIMAGLLVGVAVSVFIARPLSRLWS